MQAVRQQFVSDGKELDNADILSKNMLYIGLMTVLLILTGIVITLMLLPIPNVPKNAHIPVIVWSVLIVFSVSVDVESSVHPRLGLGWVILETFLIWVSFY